MSGQWKEVLEQRGLLLPPPNTDMVGRLSRSNLGHSHIDKMAWYGQPEGGLRFSFPKPSLVSKCLRTWK